jgi:uncharacterized membrane protein
MAVATIAILWLAFAATHMGMSSLRLRPDLVARLGERGFQGVYSLVALGIFVPLVWIYFDNKHAGAHLWFLGTAPAVRWASYLGMGAALVLVVGGVVQPSPASMASGDATVRGVLRLTRHPVFMGAGLFGLVHLLCANVHAAELVFFAGFPIFAVAGCRHQDRRKLATLGEPYRRFCEQSPLLPFTGGGIARGLGEMPLALAVGVGLAVLLRLFHAKLFGSMLG